MSDATVVSILPFEYTPRFPGLVPSYYLIPESPEGDFVVLHVDDGKGFVDIHEGRPPLVQHHSGEQIANSIVNDLIAASMYTTDVAFPGIKAIAGKHSKEDIKKNFPELLEALRNAQKLWYGEMVKAADDIWSDPNARGKSQSISDLQRKAAGFLGLNKEWVTVNRIDQVRCPACTNFIPGSALICPMCKTVLNQVEYDKKFKKAG
jgi:hypothetical protein